MSELSLLVRRYARARSATARQAATRQLRTSGALANLSADDDAFAALLHAPTLGHGATPEESPVLLALPVLATARDLLTLAFQRYLTWDELVGIREHPFLPPGLDASLLDQLMISERPPVRFDRWLDATTVRWSAVMDLVEHATPVRRLIGPPSPFEPAWLPALDRFAERFRPEDRARWLLRSVGLAGRWSRERLEHLSLLDEARALGPELEALEEHPDPSVARWAREVRTLRH